MCGKHTSSIYDTGVPMGSDMQPQPEGAEPARALHIWLFVKVFSGKREAAVAAVSASVPSIIRLRYAANTRPKLVCTVIEILSQFDLGAFKGV